MKFKRILFMSLLTAGLLLSSCTKRENTESSEGSNIPESSSTIHEHTWGDSTYIWASDYSSCTATRVCLDNIEHKETETKESVYTVLVEPGCESEGSATYTVTFENKAFAAQTHEVTLDQKGHTWETPTYEWNADYSECTATRVCANDKAHTESETAFSVYKVTKKPTCAEEGVGQYKVSFAKKCFETQIHKVKIDKDLTAHNYIESVVAATTDDEGYTLHTCEYCHDSYKTDITSAENKFTYAEYMGGYMITAYTGEAEIINVPATHNGLDVKRIDGIKTGRIIHIPETITDFYGGCFSENTQLEEVNIPEGTTTIGSMFNGCTSLKSIVIPDSVTNIGQYAFFQCSSLEEMTLPFTGRTPNDSSYYHLAYIFGGTAYDSAPNYVPQSLKKVTLSSACTRIPNQAFFKCQYLEEVVIGENVTKIGWYAFGETQKITEINIPKKVSIIDTDAFASLNGADKIEAINVDIENENYASEDGVLYNKDKTVLLRYPSGKKDESFAVPDSVIEIGESAFRNNSFVKNITMNNNVETLNYNSFYCVSNLTSIELSNKIKVIPMNCFKACQKLPSIELPEGIETIEMYAFCQCSALKTINIPASVTSIGEDVFQLVRLTSLKFDGNIRNIQFDSNWNSSLLSKPSISIADVEEPYGIMVNGESFIGGGFFGFGDGGNKKYLQFMFEATFAVGDEFVFYDNIENEQFDIAIDGFSLGGDSATSENWKDYFDFDGSKYIAKQQFNCTFYMKIDGVNNNVYISL